MEKGVGVVVFCWKFGVRKSCTFNRDYIEFQTGHFEKFKSLREWQVLNLETQLIPSQTKAFQDSRYVLETISRVFDSSLKTFQY